MNSVPSKLEKNNIDELYRKNQVKSISFLVILSGVLLLTHRQVFSMDYVPKERRPKKELGPKEDDR